MLRRHEASQALGRERPWRCHGQTAAQRSQLNAVNNGVTVVRETHLYGARGRAHRSFALQVSAAGGGLSKNVSLTLKAICPPVIRTCEDNNNLFMEKNPATEVAHRAGFGTLLQLAEIGSMMIQGA